MTLKIIYKKNTGREDIVVDNVRQVYSREGFLYYETQVSEFKCFAHRTHLYKIDMWSVRP